MMKLAFALSFAAAALVAGSAAFAADAKSDSAPTAAADGKVQAKEKLYCQKFTITGSMLEHRSCKTKKEWEAAGARVQSK